MNRGNWRVMPGEGEQHLYLMGIEVGAWKERSSEFEALKVQAKRWEAVAQLGAHAHATYAFDQEGSVEESILEQTSSAHTEVIASARADAFAEAVRRVESLRVGTQYEYLITRRAQVRVLEPGVSIELQKRSPVTARLTTSRREAVPGEVFEGEYPLLDSSPEQGGLLHLVPGRRQLLELTGLIDVETVRPRVEMEIMQRLR